MTDKDLIVSLFSSFDRFNRERIIEYRLPSSRVGPLASLTVEKFILSVGARSSAPGGGSVAALLAALVIMSQVSFASRLQTFIVFVIRQGCALSTMVGQMTYGKRQFESLDTVIRSLLPPLHEAMVKAIPMIDADTEAFNDYMVIDSLPFSFPSRLTSFMIF